jgi:mannose-6-phosphate isomerase-like protein (cupin superfamily)
MATAERGHTFHNPITRERSIVLEAPADNVEGQLVSELHLDPGAAVLGEHLHPTIEERFEVLEGRLAYKLGGETGEAGAGEAIEVPPGVWHDWWQVGAVRTVCRVTITPGRRFEEMIRTAWGLACDGQTNSKGMPSLLQTVALATEFSDVLVFKRPPRPVQRVLFGVLAPLARRRGYRGTYPRYAEMYSESTAEQVRAGEPFDLVFGPGEGPPSRRRSGDRTG